MNTRIKLIAEFQEKELDTLFEKLDKEFKPLIKYHLRTIPIEYKEDIYQEMLFLLFEIINNRFKINTNVNLDEKLFTMENFKQITKSNFKNVNKVLKISHADAFIKLYGDNLIKLSFKNKNYRKQFIYEYMLFCNERQFTFYLNKAFNNIKLDFIKKHKIYNDYFVKTLNEKINDDIELIDLIKDETLDNSAVFDKYDMNEEDYKFILNFVYKGRILTEREVAVRNNISQQLVSKKLCAIKNKHKINAS